MAVSGEETQADTLVDIARIDAAVAELSATITVGQNEEVRDEALAEVDRANDELAERLAEQTIEREDSAREEAAAQRAETEAELARRLAELTIERDVVARDEALAELARTNEELKQRLAERTVERDDIARHEALAETARSNAELKLRLAERTIERDEVARDEALTESARTNAELKERLAERDDVARTEALAELARTNAELKERLAERTIERDNVAREKAQAELARTDMAETQLRVHSAELQALNAELESFSYSVSHDLRAPVRAVIGYAAAIEADYGDVLDAEGHRLLAVVQGEAARMGDLIDDLLAFSRLGRQSMKTSVVNMTSLVREVVAEQTSGHHQTICEVDVLPDARGDRTLLRQVWVNLISNAIKYSSKSATPAVNIWGTREEDRVTYNVRDNGVGFDMAYADKLFGVFQRLHRSDEFPGTGVGLAIVHRIVQRHDGRVWADAQLGEGATFSFALPNGDTE